MEKMKMGLKEILLSNRMKSLYWRTGMMLLAVLVNQASIMAVNLGLDAPTLVFVGLVLGEISKSINKALSKE